MSQYHEPVLLQESIDGLNIKEDGIYVDVTFGGGGHSKVILAKLKKGKLYAFDQDIDAQNNLLQDDKLVFIAQNFRHIKRYLRLHGVRKVDGILADLGVSWHQFNTPERGFSIRFDNEKLDMRMNQQGETTAHQVLNRYTKQQLIDMFKQYSDLPNSFQLATAIVTARKLGAINTTGDLKNVVQNHVKGYEHKFYAQLFQAIRIEVNGEMQALRELLEQSAEILNKKGRLVVISYHSIEDRIVKNYMKNATEKQAEEERFLYGNAKPVFKIISKKVILPTTKETKRNSKASSAKMRIAEKK
ncbi:MAG: 16S rRNA (cytosine(1402)-N(4))-methyltransferase RsmH [Chitinophagales bacterium]